MSLINEITWQTNKEEFLKDADIQELISEIQRGNIEKLEENAKSPIQDEMKRGLSEEALQIDSRSPLNEIAKDLVDKITVSIEQIEEVKDTIQKEGNIHRKEEADTYYEKIIHEYQKRLEQLNSIQQEYNSHLEEEKTVRDIDAYGNVIQRKNIVRRGRCTIQYFINSPITITSIDKSSPYYQYVVEEVDKINSFYEEYVVPAYELKEECDKLDTTIKKISLNNIKASKNENLPYGVEEGATEKTYEYSNGSKRKIYTNPDGSTVTVDFDENDNIKFQRLTDEKDMVTETIWYDPEGNITKKFEFEIEEVEDGVYLSTPRKYEINEEGNLEEVEDESIHPTYYWYDQNNRLTSSSKAPSLDEVGTEQKREETNEEITLPTSTVTTTEAPSNVTSEDKPSPSTTTKEPTKETNENNKSTEKEETPSPIDTMRSWLNPNVQSSTGGNVMVDGSQTNYNFFNKAKKTSTPKIKNIQSSSNGNINIEWEKEE